MEWNIATLINKQKRLKRMLDSYNDMVNQNIINEIWELVNDRYVLFNIRNICWESVGKIFLKRTENLLLGIDIYDLIEEMLLTLGDPHTRLIREISDNIYISSVGVFCLENEFYIMDNYLESSRLRKGMKIIGINELTIDQFVRSEQERLGYNSLNMVKLRVMEQLSLATFKKSFKLKAQDDNSQSIAETIQFMGFTEIAKSQTLTKHNINLKLSINRKIGDVYYYKPITFMNPMLTNSFLDTIDGLEYCENLIIDLRGNMGGLIEETKKFAGLFLEKREIVGYQRRNGLKEREEILVEASNRNILGSFKNIVFLCDCFTGSSAEFILLKAIKGKNKKITIMGTETAGFPHSATVFTLRNNYKLQITTVEYQDENGIILKDTGIQPDIVVKNDKTYITLGIDRQLKAALQICAL